MPVPASVAASAVASSALLSSALGPDAIPTLVPLFACRVPAGQLGLGGLCIALTRRMVALPMPPMASCPAPTA